MQDPLCHLEYKIFTFHTLRELSAIDLCLVKNLCLYCESPLLLLGLFFVSFNANMVCAVTDGIERIERI